MRRTAALILIAAFFMPGLSTERTPPETEQRPNILLIVTDDQRPGTLRYMRFVRNFFERSGRFYRNAYVTTPLCCPSRASIMTGDYAHNHGVINNQSVVALDHNETVQAVLQAGGYTTAMVGKFLNGWGLNAPPHFDRFALVRGNTEHFNQTFNVDGDAVSQTGYTTDFIGRMSRRFVLSFERSDQSPWFLYLALTAPHKPFQAAPRHRDAPPPRWRPNPAVLERDLSDKPPFVRQPAVQTTPADGRRIFVAQYRMLLSIDQQLQRLWDVVTRAGEARNTIVVFMSDNGYLHGEHGLGNKTVPYLHSVHVPMAARWPGHIPQGSSDQVVANIDVAPTILQAAGIGPARQMDGRSLLAPNGRNRMSLEYWRSRDINLGTPRWASIITKGKQYTEYYGANERVTFREYYNLVTDPWQLRNRLGNGNPDDNPDVTAERAQLRTDLVCSGPTCP